MNKIYDKLLLAIAVLLLAGGVFLYMQQSGAAPSPVEPVDVVTADNPYQPVAVSTTVSTDATWPVATGNPSRPDWIYDVFTPPEIFIGKNGEFTQIGWKPEPPKPPFDIYLAELARKPYRLQLEGYIEEDRNDASKSLLLMYDEEAEKQVRVRPGQEKPGSEFKLLEFDLERKRDENGNVEISAVALILDQRTGEEVTLKHGERRFEDGFTVTLKSEQDPMFTQLFNEVPAEFEGPAGQYILREINLEESTVTVEKEATEDDEPEIRSLSMRSSESNSAPTPASTESQSDDELDGIFDMF